MESPRKARLIALKLAGQPQELALLSGRKIRVHSGDDEELVEIVEAQGEVVLRVRLTDDGPVISAEGVRLGLRAADSLTLEAREIAIRARETALLHSDGKIAVEASEGMELRSEDDIRLTSKMIYLN